jgi:hypothetical protein
VGHAGGQLTDGFHFLGLTQLSLQQSALRDILSQQQQMRFRYGGSWSENGRMPLLLPV